MFYVRACLLACRLLVLLLLRQAGRPSSRVKIYGKVFCFVNYSTFMLSNGKLILSYQIGSSSASCCLVGCLYHETGDDASDSFLYFSVKIEWKREMEQNEKRRKTKPRKQYEPNWSNKLFWEQWHQLARPLFKFSGCRTIQVVVSRK